MVWEQRWHPLREEWVLVATHRMRRPWNGALPPAQHMQQQAYEPDCPLCPNNVRSSGLLNPNYKTVYVFDNDFPLWSERAPVPSEMTGRPFRVAQAWGATRVICYSPIHNTGISGLGIEEVEKVVATWQEQTAGLLTRTGVEHVLIFENRGELVGASLIHPHAQIYATNFVWKVMELELQAQRRYGAESGRSLMLDVLAGEQKDGRRLLQEDDNVVSFVPYFARYPFEIYVLPTRQVSYLHELDSAESTSLAKRLKDAAARLDGLWGRPFSYVMTVHQAPRAWSGAAYHAYISFAVPWKSPGLMKYLAGEVAGGNFMLDSSPEESAQLLRNSHGDVNPSQAAESSG